MLKNNNVIEFDQTKQNLGQQLGLTSERAKSLLEQCGKMVSQSAHRNPLLLVSEMSNLCLDPQEVAFCMLNAGYNRAKQIARRVAKGLKERQEILSQIAHNNREFQKIRNCRPYNYLVEEATDAIRNRYTTDPLFNAYVNHKLPADVRVNVDFLPSTPSPTRGVPLLHDKMINTQDDITINMRGGFSPAQVYSPDYRIKETAQSLLDKWQEDYEKEAENHLLHVFEECIEPWRDDIAYTRIFMNGNIQKIGRAHV